MRQENNIVGAVIIFFILLFLYTKFIGPIPFAINAVQTTNSNLFTAQGTGSVTVVPNTATFSFGVTKTASNVSDAQNQTNGAVNKILDAIKGLGIDAKDITTTDYSVNPNYDYSSGSQAITGYTVTQSIQVKVTPIEKASKAVDTATANGANIVNAVTFTVDDATLQNLQQQARQKAVDDAKTKAQGLAKAAGIHLGNIVNVQEDNGTPLPRPIFMATGSNAKTDTTTPPTQLPTGESTITSNVTLSYQTY